MDISRMIRCEVNYPRDIAQVEERDFGLLFYNENIPTSYDSNHAVITNLKVDLDKAFLTISKFYSDKGLAPRIYPGQYDYEYQHLQPFFDKYGYQFQKHNNWVSTLQGPSIISPVPTLRVEKIHLIDKKIEKMMVPTEGSDRNIKGLKMKAIQEHIQIYCAYLSRVPVSIASLSYYGGIGRVEDVLTGIEFRGKGYCSTLIDTICRDHAKFSSSELYLWATNPTAISIYKKAGFRELKNVMQFWSAWKPLPQKMKK